MRPHRLSHALPLVLLLAVAAACGDDDPGASPADVGGGVEDAADATTTDAPDATRGEEDATDDVVPDAPEQERAVTLGVDTSAPVQEVDPRFLSVAVDIAQVVGGRFWDPDGEQNATGTYIVPPYDFDDPKLRNLAAELAPGWLRIGGTDADLTWYDLSEDGSEAIPEGYEWKMTRAQWDRLNRFAVDLDFRVAFTLNAGPGPREEDLAWRDEPARTLIAYTVDQGLPVDVWELGNEVNAFQVVHGLTFRIDGEQYAEDIQAAAALVDELDPEAALAGPSVAYWPVSGEAFPMYADFLAAGGDRLDLITWHYYPQQSRRCPIAVRPAGPYVLMEPDHLAEVDTWAGVVERERDAHAPGTPIWLGESGHAQCGGEPGVSDRFVSGFWWLDQLGRMARRGHRVAVRQTLSGSDYGIIDDVTLDPNPDYWNSVLWKRLMGPKVLDVHRADADAHLTSWSHCATDRVGVDGAVVVLLLNVDRERGVTVTFDAALGRTQEVYLLTAPDLLGKTVQLNGVDLVASAQGELPPMPGEERQDVDQLELPPASYAFVVFPDAAAAACQP